MRNKGFALLLFLIFPMCGILAAGENLGISSTVSESYVLIEATSGAVIAQKSRHKILETGVMAKLMTALLTAEAIQDNAISLNTMVKTSENVNAVASGKGATIWLETGEEMSVSDLLKAVVIGNANDAALALAEIVSGTEEAFTGEMNKRAFELGMKNTSFTGSHGYMGQSTKTTAFDLALLCKELYNHKILQEYFSCWRTFLRDGETELVNENKLTYNYKGTIGYKAAWQVSPSGTSGTIAMGAERENGAFIIVALGVRSKDERFSLAKDLLGQGFSGYKVTTPDFSTQHLHPVSVKGGTSGAVEVEPRELRNLTAPKNCEIVSALFLPRYINAPVTKGQNVGVVAFYADKTLLFETELVATESVDKITFSKALAKMLKCLLK